MARGTVERPGNKCSAGYTFVHVPRVVVRIFPGPYICVRVLTSLYVSDWGTPVLSVVPILVPIVMCLLCALVENLAAARIECSCGRHTVQYPYSSSSSACGLRYELIPRWAQTPTGRGLILHMRIRPCFAHTVERTRTGYTIQAG